MINCNVGGVACSIEPSKNYGLNLQLFVEFQLRVLLYFNCSRKRRSCGKCCKLPAQHRQQANTVSTQLMNILEQKQSQKNKQTKKQVITGLDFRLWQDN